MCCNLNYFEGYTGDTRSLDYSSLKGNTAVNSLGDLAGLYKA